MSLDRLEGAHPGRFRAVAGEGVLSFPSPADLSLADLSMIYQTDGVALFYLAAPEVRGITVRGVWATFDAWVTHHDLPDETSFRRLLWMLDRYGNAIEVDLRWRGVDLRALWRARDLRHLLLLVDSLPTASHTKEALHTDPEYAEVVAKAEEQRKAAGEKDDPKAKLPPLREFTPEVAKLTQILDAIRENTRTLIGVNSTKGSSAPKFTPEPRPYTAHQDVKRQSNQEVADSLAARLLPGKRRSGDG